MFNNANGKVKFNDLYQQLNNYTPKYASERLEASTRQLTQLVSMLCDELGYEASFSPESTVKLNKKSKK